MTGRFSGLAIASAEVSVYPFCCDADWNVVTDGWNETIEGAMDQAECEYGVGLTWHATST